MEKQLFFAKVELLESLEEQRSALTKEWNAYTCWYGSEEEQQAHWSKVEDLNNRMKATQKELEEAREGISKDTLKQWSKEYRNR